MIRTGLKRIIKKALGREDKPTKASAMQAPQPPPQAAPVNPPSAGRAASRPPRPEPAADDGHDHGHSHSHSHSHSHDHGHDEAPAPAKSTVRVMAEETPNPNAMKFTVSVKVAEKGSISFNSAAEAEGNALGKALFAVPGVRGIFGVNDFVTVTREEGADWAVLVPAVEAALQATLS